MNLSLVLHIAHALIDDGPQASDELQQLFADGRATASDLDELKATVLDIVNQVHPLALTPAPASILSPPEQSGPGVTSPASGPQPPAVTDQAPAPAASPLPPFSHTLAEWLARGGDFNDYPPAGFSAKIS